MTGIVIIFLCASLVFYCVLAGADFGAGALEFFVPMHDRRRHEALVNKAMGPVWEANHIWLIILIVILFNGFPDVFVQCSIYFHIPLTLMLIGIVLRGCAFSFRNYDAVKDRTHRYYSLVFAGSSLLTPVMLGMVLGGMFFGVDTQSGSFYRTYVASWLNMPSFMVGIFVLSLFTYLASVYLIGETSDPIVKNTYIRFAQKTLILIILAGALVFLIAQPTGHPLLGPFLSNPISVGCFVAAGVLTLIFWKHIKSPALQEWKIRFIAGAQVGLVFLAWFAMIFPDVLFFKDGRKISLLASAAGPATMGILAWSLMIGASLFLPLLFYLVRVFKLKEGD